MLCFIFVLNIHEIKDYSKNILFSDVALFSTLLLTEKKKFEMKTSKTFTHQREMR
jgi:hypothetical protein